MSIFCLNLFERNAYRRKLTLFTEQNVDVGGNGEFSLGDVTQEGRLTVSERKHESHGVMMEVSSGPRPPGLSS